MMSKVSRSKQRKVSFAPKKIMLPDLDSDSEPHTVAYSSNLDLKEVFRMYELPSPRTQKIITAVVLTASFTTAASVLLLSLWLNGFFHQKSGQTTGTLSESSDTRDASQSSELPDFVTDAFKEGQRIGDIPVPRMLLPPLSTNPSPPSSSPTPYILTLPGLSIQPHSFCNTSKPATQLTSLAIDTKYQENINDVLLTIITEPEDSDLRRDYRAIWSHYLPIIRANLMFVLAHSQVPKIQDTIQKEADQFGDLLQIVTQTNLQSKYYKTLVALNWTASNCPSVAFIVRMNADVLVQPKSLRVLLDEALARGYATKPVIIGDVIGDGPSEFSPEQAAFMLPKYVYRTFYIISKAAFCPIVKACRAIKPISLMEEVYLTGTCAEPGQVERISVKQFHVGRETFEMERELSFWRKMFSCLPDQVLSVSNVGKDNVLLYWFKMVRNGCYI